MCVCLKDKDLAVRKMTLTLLMQLITVCLGIFSMFSYSFVFASLILIDLFLFYKPITFNFLFMQPRARRIASVFLVEDSPT